MGFRKAKAYFTYSRQAEKWREARGGATCAAAIRRTCGGAPWSLNGSKSVVEVAPISYPSGKCNFNVFPGSYPYPYLLPGIRIFRISRESHRVATRSHRLQLRAVEDVPTSNLSLGQFG